jgi:hypothetical protein
MNMCCCALSIEEFLVRERLPRTANGGGLSETLLPFVVHVTNVVLKDFKSTTIKLGLFKPFSTLYSGNDEPDEQNSVTL